MKRREILLGGLGLAGVGLIGHFAFAETPVTGDFEVSYSDAEWKKRLGPQAYRIMRRAGTEPSGSSPLNNEKRKGVFVCAGCALPLYRSADKYDSGTGWPSFTRAIPGNVKTRPDRSLFMVRTEVHCRRCGGHLGHVFDDGPRPTGKRHCINGLALAFVPAKAKAS